MCMGMGYGHLPGKVANTVRQRSRLAIMIITVRFIYFPFVMFETDARWSSYLVRESWGGMIKHMVGVADESRRLPCLSWRPVGVVFRRFMCELYGADPTMYAAWSTALLMCPPPLKPSCHSPTGPNSARAGLHTKAGGPENDPGCLRRPRCASSRS